MLKRWNPAWKPDQSDQREDRLGESYSGGVCSTEAHSAETCTSDTVKYVNNTGGVQLQWEGDLRSGSIWHDLKKIANTVGIVPKYTED